VIDPEPIDYLSVDDLIEIATGILDEVQVRDAGLLASAGAQPAMSVFGADAYPSFVEKAPRSCTRWLGTTGSLTATSGWPGLRPAPLFAQRSRRSLCDRSGGGARAAVAAGGLDVPEIALWIKAHATVQSGY